MNKNTPKSTLFELLAHLEGAYAPNTLRAYQADMLEFIAYCEKAGNCAMPASPSTVASFRHEWIWCAKPTQSVVATAWA